jgi:hypothetical protein
MVSGRLKLTVAQHGIGGGAAVDHLISIGGGPVYSPYMAMLRYQTTDY